jgi:hypothetical protein
MDERGAGQMLNPTQLARSVLTNEVTFTGSATLLSSNSLHNQSATMNIKKRSHAETQPCALS